MGRLITELDAGTAYVEHLVASLDGRRLEGMRLVVDCAHGAASGVAREVFERVGADVVVIGSEPDGSNINAGCGSTHTETLAAAVIDNGADLGLALDGDADRLLAVDGTGTLIGGDELLALFAVDLADRGQLAGNTVVVTVMTNLGFRLAMAERGILVKETPVGDRHVLAALDVDGLALGGEQSGHIVFRQLATTGDGLLTGLVLADLVTRMGKPLSELVDGVVIRVPQVLVNVPVPNTELLADAAAVWSAVAEEQERLSDTRPGPVTAERDRTSGPGHGRGRRRRGGRGDRPASERAGRLRAPGCGGDAGLNDAVGGERASGCRTGLGLQYGSRPGTGSGLHALAS